MSDELLLDLQILEIEHFLLRQAIGEEEYYLWSTTLHLESLHMDDFPHKFVFQDHWRGLGMHVDHRWERLPHGDILDGMTIAIMKPNIAKRSVDTLADARDMMKHDEYFKLSDKPSELRMFAAEKKSETREWLTVEGIVKPGEVGATRYEYGVFAIRDTGVQYYGAQKPFFKEFFLNGKRYTSRWIYRQIERRKPETAKQAWLWQFGKPLDQTPFVLSRRAVNENWVPPWKVSCLPPSIRVRIPTKYKYWEQRKEGQRIQIRNVLRSALLKREISVKLEEHLPASLQYHWWKKRTLVRVGPSEEHWDLHIRESESKPLLNFVLTANPLETDEPIGAIEKRCPDHKWLNKGFPKAEYLPPRTVGNPTKDTPAWIEGLDRGNIVVFERTRTFMKIKFFMKRLRGLYILKRTSPTSPYWSFAKSELPKPT